VLVSVSRSCERKSVMGVGVKRCQVSVLMYLLDIGYLRGNLYKNRCLCGCGCGCVWELVYVFMSGLLDVLFVCMTTCV
jgi:hypothetical protein